eukprot:TRINITY_DN114065_c0_g1_i1.p1 TRINITY_DN114065_c0_g1~~TRINITY_DN114065_c0_g1_i1.p1  ORF type:complete len:161 (+),score=1.82 TRINITY_DN114065_c0_g1_i1:29-511(+)
MMAPKLPLLFLFLVALCPVVLAHRKIGISWKNCGPEDYRGVNITSLTYEPSHPVPGDHITFTGKGISNVKLETGKSTLHVFTNHTFNACKGTTVDAPLELAIIKVPELHCPVPIGHVTQQLSAYVKRGVPDARLHTVLETYDQTGEVWVCIQLTFHISGI